MGPKKIISTYTIDTLDRKEVDRIKITPHTKNCFMRQLLCLFFACLAMFACQPSSHRQHVGELIAQSELLLETEQPDSAWILLEQARAYAIHHGDAHALGDVCLAMSRYCNAVNLPDSALAWLNRGLAACPEVHDSVLAQYYGELSATYNITGDMRRSVDYGRRALPLMRTYGSNEDFAIMCGNIGISYRRLGQNDSAATFYQEGLQRAVAMNDNDSRAYLANNLSVLYCEMGRYEEAVHYAEEAAVAARDVGDDVERLSAEANKGIALLLGKHPDEAIAILRPAFQQADSTSSLSLQLKTTNYLLKALVDKRNWNEVATVLQKGEQLAAKLPEGNTAAAGITEARMIWQTEQGHYADALNTISHLEQLMSLQQVIPRYKLLDAKARCMSGLGRYEEAYKLQKAANIASDSVYNQVNSNKLDQLTTNYRVMEKELQLSRQSAESQRKITILVASLTLLTLLLALLLIWMRQRHLRAHMRETQKYVEGIEQERSRFARELHDGACNELLAIGIQLRQPTTSREDTLEQLSTLRAQLRNMSHELMPPQFANGVTLNEALSHYLSHIDQPAVELHAEGDDWQQIPHQTAYQVYRIVQEAIGNIITHQPEAKADVTLLYNKENSSPLQLIIRSEGKTRQSDETGIGLRSMGDRANSIGMSVRVSQTADSFVLELQ